MATTSIIQLTADLNASIATGAISQLLPSGTILPFAGRNVPSGWLLCDGSEVSKTIYANLYSALLDTTQTSGVYDTQVNPTTGLNYAAPSSDKFRLPDYRGLFLRGAGTANGGDATTIGGHQSQKTAKNGLNNIISNLALSGTTEIESRSHNHGIGSDGNHGHPYTVNIQHSDGTITQGESLTSGLQVGGRRRYRDATDSAGVHAHGFVTGTTSADHNHLVSVIGNNPAQEMSGDNETRPVNRGVNYIIKV